MTEALHALRGYAEIVLIDAPPILATGDSIALTGKVDAILVVTRLGTLTRPTLQELARVLRRSPAPVLGLVATGAEIDEGYSAYAVDEYYAQPAPQPSIRAGPDAARGGARGTKRIGRLDAVDASPRRLTPPRRRDDYGPPRRGTTR